MRERKKENRIQGSNRSVSNEKVLVKFLIRKLPAYLGSCRASNISKWANGEDCKRQKACPSPSMSGLQICYVGMAPLMQHVFSSLKTRWGTLVSLPELRNVSSVSAFSKFPKKKRCGSTQHVKLKDLLWVCSYLPGILYRQKGQSKKMG